jgi:ribonuclease HI
MRDKRRASEHAVCEAAMSKTFLVEMFTDGSCLRNPGGPGGWGVVLRNGKQKREYFGGERSTTNNRMEMLAVIEGLAMLDVEPTNVRVYTDSRYVMDGISSIKTCGFAWMHSLRNIASNGVGSKDTTGTKATSELMRWLPKEQYGQGAAR